MNRCMSGFEVPLSVVLLALFGVFFALRHPSQGFKFSCELKTFSRPFFFSKYYPWLGWQWVVSMSTLVEVLVTYVFSSSSFRSVLSSTSVVTEIVAIFLMSFVLRINYCFPPIWSNMFVFVDRNLYSCISITDEIDVIGRWCFCHISAMEVWMCRASKGCELLYHARH